MFERKCRYVRGKTLRYLGENSFFIGFRPVFYSILKGRFLAFD